MNLPPCHAFFQFYVANGRLSLQLYQRSADIFPGGTFQYSILCIAAADDGASHRSAGRALSTHWAASTYLPEPPGTGETPAQPGTAPTTTNEDQSGREKHLRLPIRGL